MTWNDAMKAAALAAQAERKATEAAKAGDAPWRWNPNDVWLSRARQPRAAAQVAVFDHVVQPRQDATPRD